MKKIVGGVVLLAAVASSAPGKWNVLLITIDTLRADRLSCYGFAHVQTPNIDRLAKRGLVFTRAFAHTPTTLPSHANILLGLTPLAHGVHENSNFVVGDELWTLAEHLRKEGYMTAAFVGAYPLDSRFGLAQGFEVYDDDYGSQSARGHAFFVERKAEAVVTRASAWIREHGRHSPWFVWVHCFDPHEPYEPPPPFSETFKDRPYDGEVAYVDFALGKLLAELEAGGLEKRTLIVITGDHGESLGEHGEATHGYFAYNATLWVPLILCGPGIGPGRVEDYVCHTDIFPTVCHALSIKAPTGLLGVSLLSAGKEKRLGQRAIYFESLYPFYSRGWAPIRGIIRDKKKYIDSPIPEFYDLVRDFEEQENLAEKETLDPFRSLLKGVMERQKAPSAEDSRRPPDSETLRKLKSLGYLSGAEARKESFGREDDVKVLLPFHNRSMEARQLYLEGKVVQSLAALRAILSERKDIDVAYTNLATLLKEEGRMGEAIAVLKEGLASLPTNYAIFSTYVNFLITAGQFDEVIAAFSSFPFRQMDYDPEIWNFLGIAYGRTGRIEEALAAFERSLSLDEKFSSSYVNRGMLFLSRVLEGKEPALALRAREDFRKAITLDPGSETAFNGLGVLSRLEGQLDEAISHFNQALKINPDFKDALYNLGLTHLEKGEFGRARDIFVDYRKKFAPFLSPAERQRVEAIIEECRRRR